MPIRNVGDAMRELKSGGSTHITSRAQAIAVGLKAEGKSKYQRGGGGRRKSRKASKGRSLGGRR